jgi:spermidine/putrescine transport system permease protein
MMKFLKKSYVYCIFAFLYVPILVLVLFSFNNSRSRGNWGGFTLRWYRELFADGAVIEALLNTLMVAGIAATIATIIGTFAALGLYFMRKRPREWIMNFTYIPILNPEIVTGVSLMLLFIFLRIPAGFTTLILAHITFNIPYVILAILPRLNQLNPHLFEAAEDLGASFFYTLRKVIIPEIRPGIVTGLLLAITLSIDDFVVSFFTRGAGATTLSVMVYGMARRGVRPTINALSTIMFAVVLIMLIIVNIRTNKQKEEV